MSASLRIDNRKFYYEAAVDPSATDTPYRNAAEWKNTATGDIFDWDRYAESWKKRVLTAHTHAHNDTTSKQGGTTNEHYHLTAAELAKLTAFPNKITVSATEPATPSTGDLWVDIS